MICKLEGPVSHSSNITLCVVIIVCYYGTHTRSEQGSDKPVAFILLLSKYLTATPSLPVQLCIMV